MIGNNFGWHIWELSLVKRTQAGPTIKADIHIHDLIELTWITDVTEERWSIAETMAI